jgi:hypothetical protein
MQSEWIHFGYRIRSFSKNVLEVCELQNYAYNVYAYKVCVYIAYKTLIY